ncbi:MAG: hypothetical protein LUF82_04840 [Clostridia bacterium]|nr:hypothetical protein [Clostridia bacterium]
MFQNMDIDIDTRARDRVKNYMAANNVSPSDLISLAKVFPAKTTKNLMYSGLL